jgi:hypothetical protein
MYALGLIEVEIAAGNSWRRHVRWRGQEGLQAIGLICALAYAEETPLPAFREMADTMRWEDMR